MDTLSLLMIIVPILLLILLIYYMKLRESRSIATMEQNEAITGARNYEDMTHEDVLDILRSNFSTEQHTEVLDAIAEFSDVYRYIILKAAEGSIDKVREYVKVARKEVDIRDLILDLHHLNSK